MARPSVDFTRVGAFVVGGIGLIGSLVTVVALEAGRLRATALGAAACLVVGAVVYVLSRRPRRRGLTKAVADALAVTLHTWWFVDEHCMMDRNYRISVFVPHPAENPSEWRCLARTITSIRRKSWPRVTDGNAIQTAGVVNATAIRTASQSVLGVPMEKRQDLSELKRYHRQAYTDASYEEQRLWPYATMLTLLARKNSGPILCVLVVERKDGEPIDVKHRFYARDPEGSDEAMKLSDACPMELELAAKVLQAAWEDDA